MKVLYLGYYRDGTGWAKAAQNYILALDEAGVDVVPRYIKLNNNNAKVPQRISELETKSDSDCNIIIQNLLPHHMDFSGEFDKNIALYYTETDSCFPTNWPERVNLMDEAWVPNVEMAKNVTENSHININHHVVPVPCDVSIYQREYEKFEVPEIQDCFKFYYIGELSSRKNISFLLRAFHSEFRPEENVSIILKCTAGGLGPSEIKESLSEISKKVKEGLKIYSSTSDYINEVFVTQYLPDEDIIKMHASFDCFVSATLGEAWGVPIFDAMSMGKTPICTSTAGPNMFVGDGGYLVKSSKDFCFGVSDTFQSIYTGTERWDRPDMQSFRSAMRKCFEGKNDRKKRSENGIENAYKYSFRSVGKMMKNILEGGSNESVYKGNQEKIKKHCI